MFLNNQDGPVSEKPGACWTLAVCYSRADVGCALRELQLRGVRVTIVQHLKGPRWHSAVAETGVACYWGLDTLDPRLHSKDTCCVMQSKLRCLTAGSMQVWVSPWTGVTLCRAVQTRVLNGAVLIWEVSDGSRESFGKVPECARAVRPRGGRLTQTVHPYEAFYLYPGLSLQDIS